MRHRFTKVLLGAALFTLLAGTASVAARSHHTSASSYNIGFIYPRTGILGAYGAEELEGFKYGLQYATNGTGKVNGKTLNITYQDDQGVAATGVTEAKALIGQGVKILMGTGSSGVAVQIAPLAAQNQVLYISGPAAADAITGINKYTFRAGRQTIQDVLDAKSFLGKSTGQEGRRLRPGQRLRSRQLRCREGVLHRSQRLRGLGAAHRNRLHAVRAAGEERERRPDLRRLGRHHRRGDVQDARPAGSLHGTQVITGLAERATWAAFGSAATKIHFLSHYVYTAPNNKVNDWLVTQLRKRGQVPDIFTPDGFVEAQMLVHALQKGDYNVDKMISALEGWKFLAPKGYQAIRPQDHAMLQPMFRVALVTKNGHLVANVLGTASPYDTAPPLVPMKG